MEVIQRSVESFPLRIPASQGEIHLRPSPITPSISLHDLYVLHYLVDPAVHWWQYFREGAVNPYFLSVIIS